MREREREREREKEREGGERMRLESSRLLRAIKDYAELWCNLTGAERLLALAWSSRSRNKYRGGSCSKKKKRQNHDGLWVFKPKLSIADR